MKKQALVLLLFVLFQGTAFCREGFYEAEAFQYNGSECKLDSEGTSAGGIRLLFEPFPGDEGYVDYDGLSLSPDEKNAPVPHYIRLTTIIHRKDESYTFEGVDETIPKGTVRGIFRDRYDFEINGYGKPDCLEYQLVPFSQDLIKKKSKK